MSPTLRPYQRASLEAVSTALQAGVNRQLLQKPTGTGKTVTFAELPKWPAIAAWLQQFPAAERHMLVIAHREELLDQAAAKIRAAHPELLVGIEQGPRSASLACDVVVASIQTLSTQGFVRLERLLSQMTFRIVVVDEAHHTAAKTYRAVLARLGFLPTVVSEAGTEYDPTELDVTTLNNAGKLEKAMLAWDVVAPKDRLLVGVTATPNRTDAIGLSCVYQQMVYSYRLRDAITDGWLTPILPYAIETTTSLDDVRTTRGEFVQSSLSEAVNTQRRNATALAAWQELAEGLPTIVFSVDVAHAHSLADTWTAAGYRAAAVSGETPREERKAILADYAAGKLDAVMNCMVLTEGTDLPNTSCILHAKPTTSATLYEQMTGRGLRPLPGDPVGPDRKTWTGKLKKPECIVIDIVDIARRHSLQMAPVLYGLPPGLLAKGVELQKLSDDVEAFLAAKQGFDMAGQLDGRHLTLEQLQKRAEVVDLWAVPDVTELGAPQLRWLKVGDVYQLEYPWAEGYERLRISKDMLDHWSVDLRFTPPVDPVTMRRPEPRQQNIGSQILSPVAATLIAEDFVQTYRRAASHLKNTGAPWRQAPASEKQLLVLAKRRVPHNPKTLTKGQASDLLDLLNSRRR